MRTTKFRIFGLGILVAMSASAAELPFRLPFTPKSLGLSQNCATLAGRVHIEHGSSLQTDLILSSTGTVIFAQNGDVSYDFNPLEGRFYASYPHDRMATSGYSHYVGCRRDSEHKGRIRGMDEATYSRGIFYFRIQALRAKVKEVIDLDHSDQLTQKFEKCVLERIDALQTACSGKNYRPSRDDFAIELLGQ